MMLSELYYSINVTVTKLPTWLLIVYVLAVVAGLMAIWIVIRKSRQQPPRLPRG